MPRLTGCRTRARSAAGLAGRGAAGLWLVAALAAGGSGTALASGGPAAPTTAAADAPAAAATDLRSAVELALARPAPDEAPAAAVAALRFRVDQAVSEREREAAIAHLAAQPGGAGGFEAPIRSGALLREFGSLLRRYGYDPSNLGDVLAAHLVLAWEISSGVDVTGQPEGLRAVRRQLAGPLAGVPAVANMDDAAMQAQAERTAYMTMVWALAHQELKRGDPARLEALRRSVRARLSASGVDLQGLVLREGGLVPR